MNTLVHADIFFFVTTIAVIILVVLLSIALIYFIQILRNFRDISNTVRKGVDHASTHIEDLMESLENNMIFRFLFRKKKKRKKEEE